MDSGNGGLNIVYDGRSSYGMCCMDHVDGWF